MGKKLEFNEVSFARDAPNMTLKQLAEKYGTSASNAFNICRRLGVDYVRVLGRQETKPLPANFRQLTLAEAIAEQKQARKSA